MDGNERKKRGGGWGWRRERERIRAAASIARHDGSCWGFREPDKEGHLYLARRDRCSTIIDLRDGSIKRKRERERKGKEGDEGKVLTRSSRELGLTVLNTWVGVPDRVIERASFFFLTCIVSHANTVREETSTLCQRSWTMQFLLAPRHTRSVKDVSEADAPG